jgi:hypothetical protein
MKLWHLLLDKGINKVTMMRMAGIRCPNSHAAITSTQTVECAKQLVELRKADILKRQEK